MRIHRYWARGHAEAPADAARGIPPRITCLRGSDVSKADAERLAEEAARETARKIAEAGRRDEYPYPDRAIREALIETIEHGGRVVGALTRNSYGSLVLNTQRVMFIDIDVPPPRAWGGLVASVGKLLGKAPPADPIDTHRERIRQTLGGLDGFGMRLYRTAAGLRCLVTHAGFDPKGDEARGLLDRFGADPRYTQLCRTQACFRARVSPKPWRCRCDNPPHAFPFETPDLERQHREWERRYTAIAEGFATCRLLDDFVGSRVDAEAATILAVHDEFACPHDGPLA